MSITFYSMKGCHFCDKATKILKQQISEGTITVKPSSDANGEFTGFPSFKNHQNGKTHSGCPESYEHLKQLLGHKSGHHQKTPSKNTITFYSMGNNCGFCVKAEKILKQQISEGTIIVKPASDANGQFTGFPSFVSSQSGKTHSGCPQSFKHLKQLLDHTENKENYQHNNLQVSDIAKKCCSGLKFSGTPPDKPFKYGLCLCYTSESILITSNTPFNPDMLSSPPTTNIFLSSAGGTLSINDIVSDELVDWSDVQKQLVTEFPCTKQSDWKLPDDPTNLDAWATKIQKLQSEKLQPCKEDNSVYCCPGVNGPKNSVGMIGLIIAGVIIFILLVIIAFMAMKK